MRGSNEEGPVDLLGEIPLGGVLAGLWRLLLAAERREEFVGDLVEQANADLAGRPPGQISLWLFGQTLHSAPSLLVARARRLGRRTGRFPGAGTRQLAAGMPGLLLGGRGEQRSWPLPVAISVSEHALALFALAAFTMGKIEEIEAPWVQVAIKRAFAPLPVATVTPPEVEPPAPRRARKPRPSPRPAVPEVAPPAPQLAMPPELPIEDPEVREVIVVVPPAVTEKRCLSCPKPRLPPAYARLGVRQQVVVKTCVGSSGEVTSVNVVRGLGPLADAGVVDTVRGWRFQPHAVGDHPVPFCYPTRFVFTMN